MSQPTKAHFTNKTSQYFLKLCELIYLAGFPNLWMEDLNYSKRFTKFYDYVSKFTNGVIYLFVVSEWASTFTQHNLTERQSSDSLLFKYSHPILFSFRLIMTYHQAKVKELIYRLSVKLKEVFNDEKVEQEMIRKCKLYSIAFSAMCSMTLVFYGFNGLMLAVKTDATFTTVITAWPEINDKSTAAKIARVVNYIVWWAFMSRVYATYSILLALIIALEHQHKNLSSYFLTLSSIFDEDLSQSEKEHKYEEGVKVGIKLHSDTLACNQLTQDTCSTIYCLQILLNVSVLVSLMAQMIVNSERTVGTMITTLSTAAAMLITTGFFMWTAGDVTVEASKLSLDIYGSGWHNCHLRSVSVRKLVAVAIAQAQKPFVIKGLGVIKISYRAYLSIVRSSYTIFTVLY